MHRKKTIIITIVAVFFTGLVAAPASAYYREYRPSRRGLRTWALPTHYYGPVESVKRETPTAPCPTEAQEPEPADGVFGFVSDAWEGMTGFIGAAFTGRPKRAEVCEPCEEPRKPTRIRTGYRRGMPGKI